MLKRLGALGAVIGLLALVISMIMPAAAGGNDDGEHQKRTIRVVELFSDDDEATFKFIDLDGQGQTVGDYIVIRDALYNAEGIEAVGTLRGQFLITRPGEPGGEAQVDASFSLPDGVITVAGPFVLGRTIETGAVTGGTQAFKAAQGELRIITKEDRTVFVFKLLT